MTTEYDPRARRDTPLARKLRERIGREGPISVQDYMRACLQDPEYGYYVKQPAIGAGGDFTTAPEISQVFGELIGLWCVVVWQQMGAPARFDLVELGPGRGTLMRDALRAARVAPEFLGAVRLDLVESNPTLQSKQGEALKSAGVAISWSAEFAAPRDCPAIVIGNEFLDTLPVAQYLPGDGSWYERVVTLDDEGRLAFAVDPARRVADGGRFDSTAGSVMEVRGSMRLLHRLSEAAGAAPMAALLIDYGHVRSQLGDTLQAVRGHAYEHPLTSPGEADLTTHVDFEDLAERARSMGLAVDGPIGQGKFLARLGVLPRASRLMAANPAQAGEIEVGVGRLMSPTGMGTRFKAMGLRSRELPPLPGLAP